MKNHIAYGLFAVAGIALASQLKPWPDPVADQTVEQPESIQFWGVPPNTRPSSGAWELNRDGDLQWWSPLPGPDRGVFHPNPGQSDDPNRLVPYDQTMTRVNGGGVR